jgi:hypothetical protein
MMTTPEGLADEAGPYAQHPLNRVLFRLRALEVECWPRIDELQIRGEDAAAWRERGRSNVLQWAGYRVAQCATTEQAIQAVQEQLDATVRSGVGLQGNPDHYAGWTDTLGEVLELLRAPGNEDPS